MEGKSLNYTVLIEQDKDGIYRKSSRYTRLLYSGKTVEQAMELIREIQVCLEAEELEDVTGGAIGRFDGVGQEI